MAMHISRSDPSGDEKFDNLKISISKIIGLERGHLKNRKKVISRMSSFDKILHGGVDLASSTCISLSFVLFL